MTSQKEQARVEATISPHSFEERYAQAALAQIRSAEDGQESIFGVDVVPIALVPEEEVAQWVHIVDYKKLKGREDLLENVASVDLVVHPLDAGLGESVGRREHLRTVAPWLAQHYGITINPDILGSKATDIHVPFKDYADNTIWISIAELHARLDLSRTAGCKSATFRPVVNGDSAPSVAAMWHQRVLMETEEMGKLTFVDYVDRSGRIQVGDFVMQEPLPRYNKTTRELDNSAPAPGGHGQVAALILHEIAQNQPSSLATDTVRVIKNGDGFVPGITPEIIAQSCNAGITMVVTEATVADRKGGKLGLKTFSDGSKVPTIVEVGQLKTDAEKRLFYQVGQRDAQLSEEHQAQHRPGKQPFNTNTALFHEGLLGTFLSQVKAQMGQEYLDALILPEFFLGSGDTAKLEGAMGSLILRMNEMVQADPTLKQMWADIAGENVPFIQLVFVDAEDRDEVFQPIKYAIDYAEKACCGDLFEFDAVAGRFVRKQRDRFISWGGDLIAKNTWFAEISNVTRALGDDARVGDLVELTIGTGSKPVIFPNAHHGGVEEITCHYALPDGKPVDLTQEQYLSAIGTIADGRLDLSHKKIVIDENGKIDVT